MKFENLEIKPEIIRALNENIHSLAYADNFKKIAGFLNNKRLKEVIIQKYVHNFIILRGRLDRYAYWVLY